MDWKMFGVVFGTVFLAELGDKTQIATMLFASRQMESALTVFLAAALALTAATALAVVVGNSLSHVIDSRYLAYIAGAGFIAIGVWTLWQA
ncbi:MAG: TMEM165/GDT1 family protein [Gammaproteobacteria bacterium]|nr:TMEM165/GDT1 family protein [Gammaproteobacteria bacterium]